MQQILSYLAAPFKFLLKGPTYLIAAPRKIWGLSPPARAAAVMAISLVICTLAVVLFYIWNPDEPHGEILRKPSYYVSMIVILLLTPTATYYFVRLWMEPDASEYPDIDRAWDAGVEALRENGLGLCDFPLYLILGVPNEADAEALFAAARMEMTVAGAPKGPAPLHWYATGESIYLVFTGVGRLGRLTQLAAPVGGVRAPGQSAPGIQATLVAGGPAPRKSGPPSMPSITDTGVGSSGRIMGTLVAAPGEWVKVDPAAPAGKPPASSSGLTRREAEEQSARLAYVARRLRRARQPYCGNNGVLSVLHHSVLNDIVFAREAAEAVRSDVTTLREAAQLSSAVTVLVGGMEADEGFGELVRRVGPDRARNSRFGKGFDVWNLATDENLDALSTHACGSFEDWIYTMFAAEDGLEQRTNGKLFALLCRVRRHLQPRLRSVLVGGYASDPEGGGPAAKLFSGCYFAATGRQPDQQAFVRSVIDKLDQLAEDLEWSEDALRNEAYFRRLTWLLNTINAVLLIVVAVLAVWGLGGLFGSRS